MSLNTIAKLLIGVSVVLILSALNMDTSVEGYFNIGLMHQQQNLYILSGIIFIGGIILFATAKIKETPDDIKAEQADYEKLTSQLIDLQHLAGSKALSIYQPFSRWWKNTNNIMGRFFVFIFVGLISARLFTFLLVSLFNSNSLLVANFIYAVLAIVLFIYLFLPRLASQLIARVLIVNILAWGVLYLCIVIKALLNNEDFKLGMTVTSAFFIVISLGLFWTVNRSKKVAPPT